jgi:hypothetical protein
MTTAVAGGARGGGEALLKAFGIYDFRFTIFDF